MVLGRAHVIGGTLTTCSAGIRSISMAIDYAPLRTGAFKFPLPRPPPVLDAVFECVIYNAIYARAYGNK